MEYIKLMSAVPENWNFNSVFIDNRNEIIGNSLEKLQSFRKSSKLCYNFLFSKLNSTPTKQQLRWNQNLNILLNIEDIINVIIKLLTKQN